MKPRLVPVALATLALLGCVESVDQAPAVAVADGLYRSMRAGHAFVRLDRYYSADFAKQVPDWPNSLAKIEAAAGGVGSAKLLGSQLAAKDDGPCFLLEYEVARQRGPLTSEHVFVCRDAGAASPWHIVGHAMRRLDTGQSLEAGVLPVLACVGTNCPAN